MTTTGGGSDDMAAEDVLPASWAAASDLPRLTMVESAAALPGLLPAVAWQALTSATAVVAIDPGSHPVAAALAGLGIEVAAIEPAAAQPMLGRDLLAPPPTAHDDLVRGLLEAARTSDHVVVLLPPDDTELAREVGIAATRDADVEVEWVFLVGAPRGLALLDLVGVMDRLLDPDEGCPWDLEQTHESLAPHLVEETYEAIDAIAAGDDDAMVEELGDVLMQVVFHARLAQGRRGFDIDSVATGITDKLVRRHPHVFGEVEVADAAEVKANWETIKSAEKPERTNVFDGVPRSLPSLALADKVLGRAARQGYAPDVAAAGDLMAGAVAEVLELVDSRPHGDAATDEGDGGHEGADGVTAAAPTSSDTDLGMALDEALGDLALAFALLSRALGRDPDTMVRGRITDLMTQFEAADRRGQRRSSPPTTSPDWQDLLDEVRAAGF